MTETTNTSVVYTGPLPEVITQGGVVFKQGQAQKVPTSLAEALVGPDTEFEVAESKRAAATPDADQGKKG